MEVKSFSAKYGSWALVAGAAEGLGEAFSRRLAARKMNLVMIDHQRDRLEMLASALRKEEGIQTESLHLDLQLHDAPEKMMRAVEGKDCRLLVYNAAYSRVKPFLRADSAELDAYIDVNCRTPIRLVHSFARDLNGRGMKGGILLMSSLAGLIGMQLVAPYAATKAFTWNLAEALHHDLAGTGIDIMACIAGATATPAYLSTRPEYGLLKPGVMEPGKVAERALANLGTTYRFIPGLSNRINYFILTRLLPRRMAASIANRTMAKMYRRQKAEG